MVGWPLNKPSPLYFALSPSRMRALPALEYYWVNLVASSSGGMPQLMVHFQCIWNQTHFFNNSSKTNN